MKAWNLEMPKVARNYREIMHQSGSGYQLVQGVFGMRDAQSSPNLCYIRIDIEDAFAKLVKDGVQPGFKLR